MHCSFDSNKNKPNYYRGKDCMKNFCDDFRKHLMKLINFERLKTLPLTEELEESYYKQNVCYICKIKFNSDIKIHCLSS